MSDVGDGAPISTERGQAALIGFVILIGMVAVASAGILLVGGEVLTATEHQTEEERVLQAFIELSQNMHTVSANDDVSQSIDLDAGEHGAVVKTNTSTLHISGGDVNETIHIGAIEYEGDDGTRIAYQAGAVFHETGEETQVVSSPPIYFDAEAESLSFPIIKAKDEADLSSGDITVRHSETDPLTEANLVQGDTVTVKITSEYYRGWETYFERQGGPTSVQGVETYEENQSGTVTVEFGYREVSDAFSSGAVYASDFESHKHQNVSAENASFPPLDEEINRLMNETDPEDEDVTDLETVSGYHSLEDGVYYADEIDGGQLDFNLSDGNATLVVDGDIKTEDETITVNDYEEGNSLGVYTTGDYLASSNHAGHVCVTKNDCEENEDATVIQMVLSSESIAEIGFGSGARYEGVIYAGGSGEDWSSSCGMQVCFQSNFDFYGSVVASSVEVQSSAGEFEYDESLEDAELDIYPDESLLPPQITYLNVAEHQIEIEEN
ncbi:DUF7289 family protein [Natronococcus wangiae]|uniref:DUF7289 family protein n=1 Tax=Natronococcus wangiae TaxID=3068275 RepID=UPI00273D1A2F|nr:hypothetical protein [Natronococcus sp. AD5]